MEITDKKDLIATLAGEVLDAINLNIEAPDVLYIRDPDGVVRYTSDAQLAFNMLHDVIETTINSYLLDQDLRETAQ